MQWTREHASETRASLISALVRERQAGEQLIHNPLSLRACQFCVFCVKGHDGTDVRLNEESLHNVLK